MKARVKICCIGSVEEARLAIQYGASAVGLVSAMPSGPGVIADALIAEIAATIPPGVDSFLLTSKQTAEEVIEQHRRMRTTTIQLVDAFPFNQFHLLRSALHGIRIVQVIHVRSEKSVREALAAAPYVDALLLDSGNPVAVVKELGGTGRTHDWTLSRQIRSSVAKPVFLAGGLHAGNASDAIRSVQPYGIDVCSGVRTNGALDAVKLSSLVANIPSA